MSQAEEKDPALILSSLMIQSMLSPLSSSQYRKGLSLLLELEASSSRSSQFAEAVRSGRIILSDALGQEPSPKADDRENRHVGPGLLTGQKRPQGRPGCTRNEQGFRGPLRIRAL